MKKFIYLLMLPMLVALVACGGKSGNADKSSNMALQDSVDAHGIQRMQASKTFTKNDFSSVVDADFLSKSILEGIVYDKTTPQGFVYAASVCYPQTDYYIPLSITITADGKMTIEKVDILEEDYSEEVPKN